MNPVVFFFWRPKVQLWLDWTALIGFLMGAFATLWLPDRWEPKCFFGIVLAWLSISAWWEFRANRQPVESNASREGRNSNYIVDTCRLYVVTVIAALALMLVGLWADAFHGNTVSSMLDKTSSEWLTVKLPTVMFQQIMLHLLLVPLLLRCCGNCRLAIFVGAAIFGLLHLPNPLLMLLTFVAGIVWIAHYLQARYLGPVVISHFVLAICAAGFGGEYVLNMRVGKSCVSLLPREIGLAESAEYEFPGCVVGCAERLSQRVDELIVEGWVLDSVHHTCPTRLCCQVAGRMVDIENVEFQSADANRWPNAQQAGFVGDRCFSFVAEIPISSLAVIDPDSTEDLLPVHMRPPEFKLFAANLNGHLAQLGQVGELKPIAPVPTPLAILLFPVELDGRVDDIQWKKGMLQVHGWAADLDSGQLAKQICIEVDGQLRSISLERYRFKRSDFVRGEQDLDLSMCGFSIPASGIRSRAMSNMRCFAVDSHAQLHPLAFLESVQIQIANQIRLGDQTESR